MRSAIAAAVLLAVPAFAEDKPQVRALVMKDVKLVQPKDFGAPPKAIEIKTADELAKSAAFADDAGRDAIKKQVDFTKEKLVVFAWSGSGGDQLTPELKADGKKLAAVFTYKVGETDDLRRHALAFVVPKDAEVKVVK
jgi:hypothetical protein